MKRRRVSQARLRHLLLWSCTLLVWSLSLSCGRAVDGRDSGHWLFVSLLREKKILTFRRLPNGLVRRFGETLCSAEPACMSLSRDQRTLYVSYRSTGQLAAFHVDGATGKLTQLSLVKGGADPAYLLPDRSGRYLLSAYYESNQVAVHPLEPGGAIGGEATQIVPTAEKAHGISISRNNRLVYVSHTGADRIYQFHFDETTGKLSPHAPAFVSTPAGEHPRHIRLHPTDRWAYVSNEASDSLGVFEVGQETGVLRRVQTVGTLPSDFDGQGNATARCEMSPDGRFVYVANRGHDSIACFAIDQRNGRARLVEIVPTEKTPRSLTVDPSGKYLYAAGQASGKIALFGIAETGALQRLATFEAGPVAWWVLAGDIPK